MRAGVWTAVLKPSSLGAATTAAVPVVAAAGREGWLPEKPHPLGPSARVASPCSSTCPATPGNAASLRLH